VVYNLTGTRPRVRRSVPPRKPQRTRRRRPGLPQWQVQSQRSRRAARRGQV